MRRTTSTTSSEWSKSRPASFTAVLPLRNSQTGEFLGEYEVAVTLAPKEKATTTVLRTATARIIQRTRLYDVSAQVSLPSIDVDASCEALEVTTREIIRAAQGPKPTATPPPNDALAGAPRIAVADTLRTTTRGAALLPESSLSCVPDAGRTVWYSFVGTGMPVHRDTAGSSFDTALAVYQQQDGELPEIACADDVEQDYPFPTQTLQAQLDVSTTAGCTYYVQVAGCTPTTAGSFSPSTEVTGPRRPGLVWPGCRRVRDDHPLILGGREMPNAVRAGHVQPGAPSRNERRPIVRQAQQRHPRRIIQASVGLIEEEQVLTPHREHHCHSTARAPSCPQVNMASNRKQRDAGFRGRAPEFGRSTRAQPRTPSRSTRLTKIGAPCTAQTDRNYHGRHLVEVASIAVHPDARLALAPRTTTSTLRVDPRGGDRGQLLNVGGTNAVGDQINGQPRLASSAQVLGHSVAAPPATRPGPSHAIQGFGWFKSLLSHRTGVSAGWQFPTAASQEQAGTWACHD